MSESEMVVSSARRRALGVGLCLQALLALAHGKTIAPRFSWDTVQPFLHFANSSGPFAEEVRKQRDESCLFF